jgi:hypothetical protein
MFASVLCAGRGVLVLVLALATGCTPAICGRTSDCSSGMVCTSIGACVVPADASVDDGASTGAEISITPIRDADGDAFDIEPIDAELPIDADELIDADLIDAPDDDGLIGGVSHDPAGNAAFDGVW